MGDTDTFGELSVAAAWESVSEGLITAPNIKQTSRFDIRDAKIDLRAHDL